MSAATRTFARLSSSLALAALVTASVDAAPALPSPWSLTASASAIAAPQDALQYVQAGARGAKVRNVPDTNGLLVADVGRDTPLAVYEEKAGFLHVSVPGGFRVWVYGSLLAESGRPGWLELTGNQVNMRPEPRTKNSFPIGQLHKGDRVRFVRRADPTLPMAEDWVEVWSPSTARAWVAKSETNAIAAGTDGAALFGAAAASAAQSRSAGEGTPSAGTRATQGEGATGGSTAAANGARTDVYAALASAQVLLREALGSDTPNFAGVRAAYSEVTAMNPDPGTRRIVERDLEQLQFHEDLVAARSELAAQRAAVEAEKQRQDRVRMEAELRKDPLWGRFESRGWLTSESIRGGGKRYIVTYAGERKQVIECTTGRYDLDLFVGYEVGVEGLMSGLNADVDLPTVDARTIEVISGRYRR